MLPTLLFIIYLIAGILLVHRITRKTIYPFSLTQTTAIISFKVLMGALYGYIFLHYYGGDDTWDLFYQSLGSYERLVHYPADFLQEFKPSHAAVMADPQPLLFYYYHHVENWIMVKSFALLNLISDRNYYVDMLLFDLILCAGPYILFQTVLRAFPGKALSGAVVIFFIPSVTFWLSGIRADGLLLLFIAMAIRAGRNWVDRKSFRSFAIMLGSLLGCFLFRAQFLLVFIPALAAYLPGVRRPDRAFRYFLVIYGAGVLIFLGSLLLPARYELSRPLIRTQQGFFALNGNTRFKLDTLEPGLLPVVKTLPQAVINSLLRPFPWEARGWLQYLTAAECLGLLGLFGIFLYQWRKTLPPQSHPLLLLFWFFGCTLPVLIGFVVPFPGAIVRYKIIPELFLMLALVLRIDWNTLFKMPISRNI
jgi:hypothetical protein